jgi:hypothetical protein
MYIKNKYIAAAIINMRINDIRNIITISGTLKFSCKSAPLPMAFILEASLKDKESTAINILIFQSLPLQINPFYA